MVANLKAALKPHLKRIATGYVQGRAPRRTDLPMSLWRLSRDASGILSLDGIPLSGLLERYGSPLHVVDGYRLDQNIRDFQAVPEGRERGCEMYYSYKTNPVPGILCRMHGQGVGAEVISEYELWLAFQLGVPPSKIVYNGAAKSDESLRCAIERDILLINLNCREEAARVAAIARSLGKRPRVGMRITLEGGWSGQFGEQVATGAALEAFREAVNTPELEVVGLHMHMGGETATPEHVDYMASSALSFADILRAQLGLELKILDFGGSMACPTTVKLSAKQLRDNMTFRCDLIPRQPSAVISIREFTSRLTGHVEKHYKERGKPIPRIFLEHGRAVTGNAQMLLSRILMTKETNDAITYAILDAGICIAEPVRGEYHQLFPVGPIGGKEHLYRLVGPIASPADILYGSWRLPEMTEGDALAIMDSGAYFVPFSNSFSYPQPGIVLVENGEATSIRRAETFEDIIDRDRASGAPR